LLTAEGVRSDSDGPRCALAHSGGVARKRGVTVVFAALVGGLGFLGLVVGSFLNVVIYRVPRAESIVAPRSRCPRCGVTLTALDNVPVVSYIVLKGHCRTCRAPISVQYPIIEVLTAGLFAATAARFGFAWALPAFVVFGAGLIALATIDLERQVLPKQIVYVASASVGALLVVAAAETGDWRRLLSAVACAAVWFGLFFAVNAASPRWLGFGDVRLAFLLGLALGWLGVGYVLIGLFLASFIGAAVGIGLIAAGRASLTTRISFGPFLALGAEIAIFAGSSLLRPFHGA